MNQYYNYKYKELWQEHAWDDRVSKLVPLAQWIGMENMKIRRIPGKVEKERRTDGIYDAKSHALTYPEVVEHWEERGLHYHCTSMGIVAWIAMVPVEHLKKQGYHDDMDTLAVLINVDRSDPSWCMYTLEHYEDYLNKAREENFSILFIASDELDYGNQYINIIQEAVVIFHLNYERLYLDVSTVYLADSALKDIPAFCYTDREGNEVLSPDDFVEKRGGISCIDITGIWLNKTSLFHKLVRDAEWSDAAYLPENVIHTAVGRKLAKAMYLEYKYDDARDPELVEYWHHMGLQCDFHDKNGEQWIMFVPRSALEEKEKKIPCMCIMQEVDRFDPHQAVTAFSYCYEFIEIAAQGDCMLLFFALETLDDNDMLHDILEEAQILYPLDRSRIYVTGHSHDGRFAAEYMRRHQKDIAAVATLGNEPGQLSPKVTSGFFAVSDEQIEIQASVDTPLVNLSGLNEKNCMFPLHSDAPFVRPGFRTALDTFEKRAESWQRRLRSSRCPMKSVQEIEATKYSTDYVERLLGIPADKTEVLYLDGNENYIADIKNRDGKYHLRIVALGNMPHTITPVMADLAWSYVRRFARDRVTGECIELY